MEMKMKREFVFELNLQQWKCEAHKSTRNWHDERIYSFACTISTGRVNYIHTLSQFSFPLLFWNEKFSVIILSSAQVFPIMRKRTGFPIFWLTLIFPSSQLIRAMAHTFTHTIYHVAHDLIHRLYGYSLHFYSKKIIIIFCVTIQNMTVCWLWAHIDQSCSP